MKPVCVFNKLKLSLEIVLSLKKLSKLMLVFKLKKTFLTLLIFKKIKCSKVLKKDIQFGN